MALTVEERQKGQVTAIAINIGRLRQLYEDAEALGLCTGFEEPLAEIERRLEALKHATGATYDSEAPGW